MKRFIARLVLVALFSVTTTPATASTHHTSTSPDLCALLATVAGTYGPYSITTAGDVIGGDAVVYGCDATPTLRNGNWYDAWICPILAAISVYFIVKGVMEINSQGDIFIIGAPFWDCPPYDL